MRTLKNIGNFHLKVQPHNAANISSQQSDAVFAPQESSLSKKNPWTCTIWDLPESVLICILQGMHVRDLLSFRLTHSYFRNLVDNNGSIWASVSFADLWPNEITNPLFSRAAERRNLEAVVKLAVSYLYKEGQTNEDTSASSVKAAHFLCEAERLTPKTFPFFWIFIRPPWSPDGSCCKLKTFQCIKDTLKQIDHPDVTFGTALILKLQRLTAKEHFRLEEDKYFKMAVDQKSAAGAFFSLKDALNESDKGKELEKIRLLRQIASCNILEAKLNLIRYYTHGFYGGISEVKAKEYVRDFFQSSQPSRIHMIFSGNVTTDFSRYILIDWLVEVVGMKGFSAHILYFAVSLFDRFLQIRTIRRSQVQLLGVAAIVVSSRFLGFEILTIREAAWLTDNSYTYYDVVRMMGELVATLRGNLRALTVQDYTKVLLTIVNEEGYAGVLTEYISMLCLLQAEMGQYSPAEIAASSLLLSRILVNYNYAWPAVLKEWTGFSQDSLSLCTYHIFNKCLVEGSAMGYKDTTLQAVKIRYADPLRYSVSNIKIIGHKELCRRLGVTKLITHGKDTKSIQFRNTDELVMSPQHSMRFNCHRNIDKMWVDRDSAATPPMNDAFVMDEGVSGYDGDLESESDESYDKSETVFDDLDISMIADNSDDGKHWYSCSEDNLADDSLDEAESVTHDLLDSQADNTIGNEASSKIACLSSMCQSGANLSCHSSMSFPYSCISNCSCKKSYNGSSSTINPGLSLSSTNTSPTSSVNQEHVYKSLPCGSINSASDVSTENRLDACSNKCDILTYKPLCDDIHLNSSEYCTLKKSHSSDDIKFTNNSIDSKKDVLFDGAYHACQVEAGDMNITYNLQNTKNIKCNTSILGNVQLQTVDRNSSSDGHLLATKSQGLNCNNSNSKNNYSQDKHDVCQTDSFLPELSERLKMDHSTHHSTEENTFTSSSLSSNAKWNSGLLEEFDNHVSVTINDSSCDVTSNISNHEQNFKCSTSHACVQMPATPESQPDIHKLTCKSNSLLRIHDRFNYSSFIETNSIRFLSKKARLECSASNSACTDSQAIKHLDLSFDSNFCDKINDRGMPGCMTDKFDNNLPHIEGGECSKLTLKRKSCQ